ncbi:MAG: hypothetical protein IJ164_00210 [Duodenibacillus sp.]|nr:hypothetical protein [Duodenibacillus sp.]
MTGITDRVIQSLREFPCSSAEELTARLRIKRKTIGATLRRLYSYGAVHRDACWVPRESNPTICRNFFRYRIIDDSRYIRRWNVINQEKEHVKC